MDILDEIEKLAKEREKEKEKEVKIKSILKKKKEEIEEKNLNQNNQRRKKTNTSKPKKEDEAHKKIREDIKHRIEKEKETFRRQQELVDGGRCTPSFLIECSLHFQKGHYEDVVTERSLGHECGYPICPNNLPIVDPTKFTPKYRISLSKKQVYDLSEMALFCSEECLIASKFYSSQLLDTPVYLRTPETNSQAVLHPHLIDQNEKKEEKIDESKMEDDFSNLQIVEREPISSSQMDDGVQPMETDHTIIDGVTVEVSAKTKKKDIEKETDDDWLLKRKAAVPELGFFGTLHVTLGNWVTYQSKVFIKTNNEFNTNMKEEQIMATEDHSNSETNLNQPPDEFLMKKNALFSMATLYLPNVCSKFGIQYSLVQQDVLQLLGTFSVRYQAGILTSKHWEVFLIVFMDVLRLRLPEAHSKIHSQKGRLLSSVLKVHQLDEYLYKTLVDLFE